MGEDLMNVDRYGSYDLINRFDLWEILNALEYEQFDKRTIREIRQRIDRLGTVIDMMREAKDYTRICPVCYTRLSDATFSTIIGEEVKKTGEGLTEHEREVVKDLIRKGLELFGDPKFRKEHGLDE